MDRDWETICSDRPVITTNYSAHTEFCGENARLVQIKELETAFDGKYFNGTGKWAKIGEEEKKSFVEHMRFCYENKIRTNNYAEETSSKFNWENSARIILDYIK